MRHFKQRWMIVGGTLLICSLLVFGGYYYHQKSSFSGPLEVEMRFAQEIYQIGDQMILTIQIKMETGYQVALSEITPPDGVEILEKDPLQVAKGWGFITQTQKYYLTSFAPGEYIFRDLTVQYSTLEGEERDLQVTSPILLVDSLLGKDAEDIRDLRPLAEVPKNRQLYFLFVALVLFFGLIIFFWKFYQRKRRDRVVKDLPPLSPQMIAQQRLSWLENSDLLIKGEVDRYFTILSEIMREYIENRFAIRAREMTTEEFLSQALHKLTLEERHQKLLRAFLEQADLVKYARHLPQAEQISEAFRAVSFFIDQTKIETTEEGGEIVV